MAVAAGVMGKWSGLPESDRRALSLMIVFLAVVAGYIGVLDPLLSRYQRANAELAELLERHESNTRKVGLLPRREASLNEYRSQLAQINQRFSVTVASTRAAVSRTLSELNSYARLSSVEVEAIKPGDAQEFQTYTEIPFELEVNGSYSDLRRFFYYIDTSPSLLAITQLNLRYDNSGDTRASMQVTDVVRSTAEAEPEPLFAANNVGHLRVVASEGLGYHAIQEANKQGVLDSDDVLIDLIPASDSVTVERLLLSKDIDAISLTVLDLIGYWEKGIPLIAILPIGESRGAEGLVVTSNSELQSIAEIGQTPVVVDQQGILQFVLYDALAQQGLSISGIKQQSASAAQVARDLAGGTATVGLTREPHLSRLLDLKQARLIFSTRNASLPTIDVLAVREDTIADKSDALQFLVNAMLNMQLGTSGSSAPDREVTADAQAKVQAEARFYDAAAALGYFNGEMPRSRLAEYEKYTESLDKPLILISSREFLDSSFVERYVLEDSGVPAQGNTVLNKKVSAADGS